MATREDVNYWVIKAIEMGATHVISVCDTFDWNDYPVYVTENDDLETVKLSYKGNMKRINEVIDIERDKHKYDLSMLQEEAVMTDAEKLKIVKESLMQLVNVKDKKELDELEKSFHLMAKYDTSVDVNSYDMKVILDSFNALRIFEEFQ